MVGRFALAFQTMSIKRSYMENNIRRLPRCPVSIVQSPRPESYTYSSLIFCAYSTHRSREDLQEVISEQNIAGGVKDLILGRAVGRGTGLGEGEGVWDEGDGGRGNAEKRFRFLSKTVVGLFGGRFGDSGQVSSSEGIASSVRRL